MRGLLCALIGHDDFIIRMGRGLLDTLFKCRRCGRTCRGDV